jgi:hypothetical protein
LPTWSLRMLGSLLEFISRVLSAQELMCAPSNLNESNLERSSQAREIWFSGDNRVTFLGGGGGIYGGRVTHQMTETGNQKSRQSRSTNVVSIDTRHIYRLMNRHYIQSLSLKRFSSSFFIFRTTFLYYRRWNQVNIISSNMRWSLHQRNLQESRGDHTPDDITVKRRKISSKADVWGLALLCSSSSSSQDRDGNISTSSDQLLFISLLLLHHLSSSFRLGSRDFGLLPLFLWVSKLVGSLLALL